MDNEDDVSAEDPRSRFPWNSTDTIAVEIDGFPTGVGAKFTPEKVFGKVRFERKRSGAGQKFGESRRAIKTSAEEDTNQTAQSNANCELIGLLCLIETRHEECA